MAEIELSDDPKWWSDAAFKLLEQFGHDSEELTDGLMKLLLRSFETTLRFDKNNKEYRFLADELSEACTPIIRVVVYSWDDKDGRYVEFTDEIVDAIERLAKTASGERKTKVHRAGLFAFWQVFNKKALEVIDSYDLLIRQSVTDFADRFEFVDLRSEFEVEFFHLYFDFVCEHGTPGIWEPLFDIYRRSIEPILESEGGEFRDKTLDRFGTYLIQVGKIDQAFEIAKQVDDPEVRAWLLFRIVAKTYVMTLPAGEQDKTTPFFIVSKILKQATIPNEKEVAERIHQVLHYVAALEDDHDRQTILNYWANELVAGGKRKNNEYYPCFSEILRSCTLFNAETKSEYIDILGAM